MAKTYYEYINEIDEKTLYDGLVLEGMFSDRIVPIFSMEEFYFYINSFSNNLSIQNKFSDYVRYKANRNNQLPRILGIPNPFFYEKLCATFKSSWNEIKSYFYLKTKNNVFKVSQVHLRKMKGTNKLIDLNYNNFSTDDTLFDDLRIGKKYLVNADISNCYPSIYTHAIPWALVGKETSKKHTEESFWFNSIDYCCRNMKMKETHGILIGPHTSNLISEIILCAIDEKMSNYKYIRHIDDYVCYCNSEEEAERFLEDLQKELAAYDLLLNNRKTKIMKLPSVENDIWVDELKRFSFDTFNEAIKYNSLKLFFNLVDKLVDETKNISVIYYAWKIISNYNLTRNAKDLYLKMARHYIYHYPYLYPFVEKEIIEKMKLNNQEIKTIILENIERLIAINNFEGISYCLYYVYKYSVDIKEIFSDLNKLYTFATDSKDCIVLLLASLCVKQYSQEFKKYKNYAREIIKNNEMDKYWIFCYEILTQSDLKSEWKKMKKEKITFIKLVE